VTWDLVTRDLNDKAVADLGKCHVTPLFALESFGGDELDF
jgi:hypothetical protein